MAYSEFTLETAGRLLGISSRPVDLFPDARPAAVPTWLSEALTRGGQGIHLSLISEKSRSEFVVAPVLLAGRELSGNRLAIYSGLRLDVDASRGLVGECDFILAASEPVLPLLRPHRRRCRGQEERHRGGIGPVRRPDGRGRPVQPVGRAGGLSPLRLRDHRRSLAVSQARGSGRANGPTKILYRQDRLRSWDYQVYW